MGDLFAFEVPTTAGRFRIIGPDTLPREEAARIGIKIARLLALLPNDPTEAEASAPERPEPASLLDGRPDLHSSAFLQAASLSPATPSLDADTLVVNISEAVKRIALSHGIKPTLFLEAIRAEYVRLSSEGRSLSPATPSLDADDLESISLMLAEFPTWFPELEAKIEAMRAARLSSEGRE